MAANVENLRKRQRKTVSDEREKMTVFTHTAGIAKLPSSNSDTANELNVDVGNETDFENDSHDAKITKSTIVETENQDEGNFDSFIINYENGSEAWKEAPTTSEQQIKSFEVQTKPREILQMTKIKTKPQGSAKIPTGIQMEKPLILKESFSGKNLTNNTFRSSSGSVIFFKVLPVKPDNSMMPAVPKVITLNTKPLSANCAQDGKVNSSSLGVYEPGNKAYTDGATVSEPVIVTSKKHTRTLDGSSNLDTEKVKEREPCSQIINVDTNSPFHIESVYSIQENGHLLSLQGCGNIKKAKSRKEQTKNKRAFSESFIIPESCESDPKLSADVKVKVRRLEIGSGNVANVSWTNALAATPCNNLEIPVTEPNISTGCNQITNIQIKTELDEVNVTELNEVNVEPVEKGVEEVPLDFIDVKSESVENDGFAAESYDVTELNQQKACIEDSTRYAEMIRDIMELDQHPERSYIEDTSHYAEVLRDIIELSQHPEKACMENSTHAAVLHGVTENSEVSNADNTVEPVQSKRATECPESVAAKKQKTTNVASVSRLTRGAKATNGINVENSTNSEGYQKGGKEKGKRKSGAKTEYKSLVSHGKAVQKSLGKEKKNSKAEGGMKSLMTQTAVSRMSVTRRSSRVVVPNSRFKDMVDPSKKKLVTKADNAVETLQFKGAHENPKVVAGRKQNTTSVAPVPPTTRHAEATNNVKASVESKGYQKGGKEKELKKTDAKTENKSLGHGISVQENVGNENKNSTAEKGLKSVTQTEASRVTLPAVNVISPSSRVVVFNPGINVISPSSRGVIFITVSKDVVDPSRNKSVPEQNSSNEGETMRTDRFLAGESSKTVESSVNGIAVVPSEAVLVKTTNEKLREQDFTEQQQEEHVDSSVTVPVPEQQSVDRECPKSTNPQSREQDFEQRQQEESLPVTVPVPEQQSVDRECPKLTISQRKPVRYCVYCKKTIFGGKLKRHIISRHKTEIGEILSKPEHVQNAFFNLKRREGIYEHNLKSIAEGKELSMRERRSKHRENLSVCINCKGFFSTQHFNKHKCINKNPHALKPELCQKISDEKMDTDEEFTDILNGIKEVEELCRTETMIKRIGYRHFNLRRHEKGKLNEITEEVMQEMRELGKLFLKFRNICGYERIFEDMFNEDYLPELVGAIQEIIRVEDVTKKRKEKHGQKQIHSIILKSIKTLHDMYTETKLDEKSKEMEKFKLAYTNKICEVYPQTKQNCTENSLEKAGHPDKLSAENAVEQVEEYIVTPVGTASQSLGTNGSAPEGFREVTAEANQGNLKPSVSTNTLEVIKRAMNAYKKWRRDVLSKESGKLSDLHALLKSKENILKMDNSELNFVLSCFFLAVRKENGEVYLPDTIHVFISGIQKHFQMNGRDVSFFIDTQFKGLKNCLENLLKERSKLGICLYKKQAKPITTEQEDKLWQSKLLGDETPRMLLNTMFWIIRIYFGLRGGQEHSNLALNNFKIGCDTDGRRFLQYTETMPKTNSRLKYRRVNPHCAKAYELIENPARCPVAIFQKYTSKLHPSSNPKKFYYNPIINGGLRGPWFTLVAVGHRQLNQVVKTIMHDAGYEGHYTNNSLRVTATRLTNADVPDQLIMAQTGQCSSADGLVEIR